MSGPVAARLSGDRLHLQHGPIDLILWAEGAREAAYRAAQARFQTVLSELVAELPRLRSAERAMPAGAVARRMVRACAPHRGFVTPMAAVAGAVADEVLEVMAEEGDLRRAYVNNGGDIALHLTGGTRFEIAMPGGLVSVDAASPVRGIATSGQGGRSHSLGIAESVTVLARSAAQADVAATLIANAVDLLGHRAVRRVPARDLAPDSDLGARPVVTAVGHLGADEVDVALRRGERVAAQMQARGMIEAAALVLRGQTRTVARDIYIRSLADA